MNWDALSAIGQLVGAAVVVITLVYLSRQLRASTQALITSTRDAVFHEMMEFNYVLAQDERLAWIFQRGSKDPNWESLTEEERARLAAVFFSLFKLFENMYLHAVNGSVDSDVWECNKQMLFTYVTQPGCRRYWEMRRSVFDIRFQKLVDSIAEVTIPAGHEISRIS